MRFEEPQQRGKDLRIVRLGTKLVCPDSGQIEEPLRPSLVAERCRKRGKGKSNRVNWTKVRKHVDTAG